MVSEKDFDKIIYNKDTKNFLSIADYARFKTLSSDEVLLDKIVENNKIIKLILKNINPNQYKKIFSHHLKHQESFDNPEDLSPL